MPIINKKQRHSLDSHMRVNPNNTYSINDFFRKEYRDFSIYVLMTRCSPSLDGLRIGARKALYTALRYTLKDKKSHKALSLVGECMNTTLFAHGDSALVNTIVKEGASFSHNLNPITIDGQGGSLRAPDAIAAPRYLGLYLSKYAFIYEYDSDMWQYVEEENMQLEPKILYPPVCTLLCENNIGMAPGYKYQLSVQYNPINVIDAQIEYLKNEKIKTQLRPYVRGVNPESFTYSDKTGRWTSHGSYALIDKTYTVQITDYPFDVTFKDIDDTYNKLLETGKIKDWKNFSHAGKMDYRVMLSPGDYNRLSASRSDLEKMLLLSSVVPQNILNIINEKNKLQNFQDEYALLEHFTKWRLTIYAERKTRLINVMEEKFRHNNDICQFIALVNSGKIKIQNRKKSDIKEDIKKHNLSDEVLNIEISKLTDEEKEVLLKKNEDIKKELEYIRQTDIKDMFINDLKDIRKKIKDDFV